MNKAILIGRLTKDPDIRYTQGAEPICIARYTLAADRRTRRDNQNGQTADFIGCVAFGKGAEFAEKYLHKGMKIAVTGHIQTGSYTDREGRKVYTTDVVAEEQEFCESKGERNTENCAGANEQSRGEPVAAGEDGFMNIPDGVDEELPFT